MLAIGYVKMLIDVHYKLQHKMKLVILDRDGVINYDSDNYIRSVAQWLPIPRSIEAIANLSKAGYLIAIATNQSGIARQYYSLDVLQAMHDKMEYLVAEAGGTINCIVYCPHLADDHCRCRKPKPGMLHQILKRLESQGHAQSTDADIWFVGDSLKDLQAGISAGFKTGLVKTGKGLITLADPRLPPNTPIFTDLADFSHRLLSNAKTE